MNHRVLYVVSLLGLLAVVVSPPSAQNGRRNDTNWPSFRGPNACGIAEGYATPTTWSAESGKNVLWKAPIPGLAHSSPVIWGNRIFLTTAVSGQEKPELKVGLYGDGTSYEDNTVHRYKVYCLDKKTGSVLWERTAHSGVPKMKRHPKATQANCTVATDGQRVVAFFGSEGLYCYDLKGKLLWQKDLGLLEAGPYNAPSLQWGFASSPIIHGSMVLVQCDVLKNPFLAAFDLRNGKEIWRTARDDVATWSTPTVYTEGARAQLIVNGYKHIGGYDLRTGKELWHLRGGGDIPVPTPVVGHGLVFITNAHGPLAPVYAVRLTATGDISLQGDQSANAYVAWSTPRDGGYMQTPLVYGDYLYVCRINGILSCYEAKTGKRLYQERLGTGRTGFSASPVAANGKIYIASEDGEVYVIQAGPEFKQLAVNPMGEICMATPAISEGTLFFRTQSHLIAIAERAHP
jgi:outer membrane protein assembly factor BamB